MLTDTEDHGRNPCFMADETLRGQVTMDPWPPAQGHVDDYLGRAVVRTPRWMSSHLAHPQTWHCWDLDICLAHLPQQGGAAGGLVSGVEADKPRLSCSPALEKAHLVVGLGDMLGLVSRSWCLLVWGESEEWR